MIYVKLEKIKVTDETIKEHLCNHRIWVSNIIEVNGDTYALTCSNKDRVLFRLSEQIKKGRGIVTSVSIQNCRTLDTQKTLLNIKEMMKSHMRAEGLNGLADIYICSDKDKLPFHNGLSALTQMIGIGSLRPNTMMVRFPGEEKNDLDKAFFVKLIQETIQLKTSIIATSPNFSHDLLSDESDKPHGFIDVVLVNEGDISLMLMIGYLLRACETWQHCKLRLLITMSTTAASQVTQENVELAVKQWKIYLKLSRLNAEVKVVPCGTSSRHLNRVLRREQRLGQTQIFLMSMKCDPVQIDLTDAHQLSIWVDEIKRRMAFLENVILVWNMNPASIVD